MMIAIADIEIPNPTKLDDEGTEMVNDLAESIKDVELSHPIIVRPANIQGKYILVSGEKRIYAFQKLERAEIPAELRQMNETQGKILRVHENLKRRNLPWPEQVILVEDLHKLRQEEHGVKAVEGAGRPRKEEGKTWGIRETAAELGMALGPLSEDLNLARAVRTDPSLRNVKDKKTAVRLIRIAKQRHVADIESRMPSEQSYNEVFCGDSASILKQFPDRTFDHCITDPPWIKFFDEALTIDQRTLPVFRELYRVLKNDSFLLVFAGMDDVNYYSGYDIPDVENPRQLRHVKGELEKLGFSVSKTPAIWKKLNSLSRRGVRSWEYDRDFEFVIVAVKGSPAMVHSTTVSSFKEKPAVPARSLIHPNEKPTELIADFLRDISYEGNLIVDPFGGSGVTAAACKELKRRYIVCERDPESYSRIMERLKGK